MSKGILIQGGRLIDPAQGIDEETDLLIEEGKVAKVGKNLKAAGAEVVSAKGKVVCPGFIDLHVHFRTPGQEHKETILSGCRSAVKGGFTTVCTMANTDPVADSAPIIEYIKAQGIQANLAHLLPFGAVTLGLKGETLTEMGKLKSAGAVGFSDDGVPVMNAGVMRRALEYTRQTGLPIVSHCEDKHLSGKGVVHAGEAAVRLGLAGIPSESEAVMIARDLLLAEATDGRIHIAHVSTAAGVELIRAAKKKGIRVTAEVTPHHLTQTDEVLSTFESRFKMNPPLRAKQDMEALREGLIDGTLDAIATDHAPHAQAEKESELEHAPFGVVGLETAAAVLLTELVHQEKLPLATFVAALTHRPARVLGIDRGTLAPGAAADIVLLDLEKEWTVEPAAFESKGKNSSFSGWRLKGQVSDVWVEGRPVLHQQKILNGDSA